MTRWGRFVRALGMVSAVAACSAGDGVDEGNVDLGTASAALTTTLFEGLDDFSPPLSATGGLLAVPPWHPPGQLPSPPIVYQGASEHTSELGTDFKYGACIQLGTPEADGYRATGDLQFRISAEGRYGVAFEVNPSNPATSRLRFYRFKRRTVQTDVPGDVGRQVADSLQYQSDHTAMLNDVASSSRACVDVVAVGTHFIVNVDGVTRLVVDDVATASEPQPLRSGRFGLLSLGRGVTDEAHAAHFSSVNATADVDAPANFAVLYSTLGYERLGTKRAMLRSISGRPSELANDAGNAPFASTFQVLNAVGQVVKSGTTEYGKMFGMRLWTADFSDIQQPGSYRVRFQLPDRVEQTAAFSIADHLLTNTVMRGLSILNAQARDAAVEDFRNNWSATTGASAWSVDRDGAFVATNADTGAGATLQREMNGSLIVEDNDYHGTLNSEFTLTGNVAILNGCDAALQFWVAPNSSYSISLQAGANGKCPMNSSSGSVRLDRRQNDALTIVAQAAHPIEAARYYDVVARVAGGMLTVALDGQQRISQYIGRGRGKFGLFAWGSTARFDKVRAWRSSVGFKDLPNTDGTRERIAVTNDSGLNLSCEEASNLVPTSALVEPAKSERMSACYPLSSQRHGFHDCNNYIGEATSHGAFLSGLLDVWSKRRSALSPSELSQLRDAILTNDRYLDDLFRYGGSTGQYAHGEPSRGGIDTNLGYHQTLLGAYGDSAFATRGADLDAGRSRAACIRVETAVRWLDTQRSLPDCRRDAARPSDPTTMVQCGANGRVFARSNGVWYNDLRSLLYERIATCATQHSINFTRSAADYRAAAISAGAAWVNLLQTPAGLQNEPRDIGRLVPWLEGVDEIIDHSPPAVAAMFKARLQNIASNYASLLGPGFHIMPQATMPPPGNADAWNQTEEAPTYTRTHTGGESPSMAERRGYFTPHFATSAYDASVLWRHTRTTQPQVAEKIAAGSLGWISGLNPGLPSSKVVGVPPTTRPWSAATFLTGKLPQVARARGFTSFLKFDTRRKPIWPQFGEDGEDLREVWWINPNNDDFITLLNGHVVISRDVAAGGQKGTWEYWNQGENGWESGETFMANDGAMLKALLYYEDVAAGVNPPPMPTPTNQTRPVFFDVTPAQRLETGWGFGNVDTVSFAVASRMAHNFCTLRGFVSGHPTGHQNVANANTGVFCYPTQSLVRDVSNAEAGFSNIDTVSWALASRSAHRICTSSTYVEPGSGTRTYVGGTFTGHRAAGVHGLACLRHDTGRYAESGYQQHVDSGQYFANIDTVPWAQGSRAAANMCSATGYPFGGFLTGRQTGSGTSTWKPLVCVANTLDADPFEPTDSGIASIVNRGGQTALAVLPSTGSSFSASWTDWSTDAGWDTTSSWVSGNFTGTGRTSIATIWNYGGSNVFTVRTSNGAAFSAWHWLQAAGGSGGFAASTIWLAGDFTGDGKTDLAGVWNNAGNTSIAVWPSTGSAFAWPAQWITTPGWDPNAKWVAGKFNNDAYEDIGAIWNDGGYNTFTVRASNGSSFGHAHWLIKSGGWMASTVWRSGKFTEDGRTDIAGIWNNGGSASVAVWPSTGSAFGAHTQWITTESWDPGAKWIVGDYDNDGKDDLAAAWQWGVDTQFAVRRSTGAAFTLESWLQNAGPWSASTIWLPGKFL